MKKKIGHFLLKLGSFGFICGMALATIAIMTGYRGINPGHFMWFMGISFVVGFLGTGLEDQKSPEARIVIGTTELNAAQSDTVRIAVSSMLMRLQDPREREALGGIAISYEARLAEIQNILLQNYR